MIRVARMQYLSSEMPLKMFYASLWAGILRIAITTAEIEKVKFKIKSSVMKQGRTKSKTKQCHRKIYGRHSEIFRSFLPISFD